LAVLTATLQSDTTSGTMITAILASVLYPETLVAVHAELDQVIGQDRAPELSDLADLPYCKAFIQEVRWLSEASSLVKKTEVHAFVLFSTRSCDGVQSPPTACRTFLPKKNFTKAW
jgi:hypothetical protein